MGNDYWTSRPLRRASSLFITHLTIDHHSLTQYCNLMRWKRVCVCRAIWNTGSLQKHHRSGWCIGMCRVFRWAAVRSLENLSYFCFLVRSQPPRQHSRQVAWGQFTKVRGRTSGMENTGRKRLPQPKQCSSFRWGLTCQTGHCWKHKEYWRSHQLTACWRSSHLPSQSQEQYWLV